MAIKPLIFITGTTGFVGFAVLLKALAANKYRIRLAVRKTDQIETLKNNPNVATYLKQQPNVIEFVIVEEITKDGAFDGESVLGGVEGVIHVASPTPWETQEPEKDIVIPAIKGTTSLLNSALKYPAIKRIVITSSMVAITPPMSMILGDTTNTTTSSSRVHPLPKQNGPFPAVGGPPPHVLAYLYGKTLALAATEDFIATQHPSFSIVNIMPGYVLGPHALATGTKDLWKSTNALVLSIAVGKQAETPNPGSVVHVEDVAEMHVRCLDSATLPLANGKSQDFLMELGRKTGNEMQWDDARSIIKKHFAKALENDTLKEGGSQPTTEQRVDIGKSAEVLGRPLKGYEEMVKDIVEQYLQLVESEGSL
ncbi:hypothetical protein BGZ60DRAFT_522972 [Tricladium varicosporioides]|nr:hypothetical protein BGZ60DRAFT_522972 [Hymenoscyphus varicosporioides]